MCQGGKGHCDMRLEVSQLVFARLHSLSAPLSVHLPMYVCCPVCLCQGVLFGACVPVSVVSAIKQPVSLVLPAFGGIVFGLVGIFVNDYRAVVENGFFQGYNNITWIIVCLQVSSQSVPMILGFQHVAVG